MAGLCTLGILSDIHYAGAAEQARGDDYEMKGLTNPVVRLLVRMHRRWLWLDKPLRQNHLLDRFLAESDGFDYVIANGDYSCNSVFIGVGDEAACQSAGECLGKLRRKFGDRLRATFGDHELGKITLAGNRGGMRLTSWRRAVGDLGLEPFWQLTIGDYVLIGVVSSLVALPVFEADTLPEERTEWLGLRAEHLAHIRQAFAALQPRQRVLLFCHDPTALPFLGAEPEVFSRFAQIEQTIIGHLHSSLILWKSRALAGMPRITFMGHTAKKLTTALRAAREWRPFHVRLCPSLTGIQLLKDGGYLTVKLDPEARQPLQFNFHALPWQAQ
jgi:hypothetical protein